MKHNLISRDNPTTYVYILKTQKELRLLGKLYRKLSKDEAVEKNGGIRGKLVGVVFDSKTYDHVLKNKYFWIGNAIMPGSETGIRCISMMMATPMVGSA